jgi:hypothetical protein
MRVALLSIQPQPPGPNFEQRDRPLLGVKAVVDLTLMPPLGLSISVQRLSSSSQGKVVYKLKTTQRDGTTQVKFRFVSLS